MLLSVLEEDNADCRTRPSMPGAAKRRFRLLIVYEV